MDQATIEQWFTSIGQPRPLPRVLLLWADLEAAWTEAQKADTLDAWLAVNTDCLRLARQSRDLVSMAQFMEAGLLAMTRARMATDPDWPGMAVGGRDVH